MDDGGNCFYERTVHCCFVKYFPNPRHFSHHSVRVHLRIQLRVCWSTAQDMFRGMATESPMMLSLDEKLSDTAITWLHQCCLKSVAGEVTLCGWVPAGSLSRGGDGTVCVKDINQPTLPTPFYSILESISVCMALSTVFRSENSPDKTPFLSLLFRSYLCLTDPFNYIFLESLLQPCCNP